MSSTSVRPITESEKAHGDGEPLVAMTSFFGLTTGILAHMNYHKVSIAHANWFPTAHSRALGVVMIGGGLVLGKLTGQFLFSDPSLQRLKSSHDLDNESRTWAFSRQ